jgi:hypothetical protein
MGPALPAVGPGIPTTLAIGTTARPFTCRNSAEEILDRLVGYCRSLNK